MAKKRYVSDSFWSDQWVEGLSIEERLLYLYLITNQYIRVCGIYEIQISRISFETGITKENVISILERFKDDGKVFYNDGVVFIVNFVKNQSVKTQTDNLWKGIEREIQELGEKKLDKIRGLQGAYNSVEGAYKDLQIPYFTLLYQTKPNSTLLYQENGLPLNKQPQIIVSENENIFKKPERKFVSITIKEKERLEEERGKSIVDPLLDRIDIYCRANNKKYGDYGAAALQRLKNDGKKERGKRKYEDKTHEEWMIEFEKLSENYGTPFKAKYGDDFGKQIKEMYKKHAMEQFRQETFSQ